VVCLRSHKLVVADDAKLWLALKGEAFYDVTIWLCRYGGDSGVNILTVADRAVAEPIAKPG
jgi:hypothetical protein